MITKHGLSAGVSFSLGKQAGQEWILNDHFSATLYHKHTLKDNKCQTEKAQCVIAKVYFKMIVIKIP